MKKEAVLLIYYTDKNGRLRMETQGKFFYYNNKATYLANMTSAKWWKNYGGYSIAKQLLDAFKGIKMQIIYRLQEKGILYYTTPTAFKNKGILVPYGGHEQYVLPIYNFKAAQGTINDPRNLPVMRLSDWKKDFTNKPDKQQLAINELNPNEWLNSQHRLSETFKKIVNK